MSELPALIVFSHLRWDFVYQRPQQLMSRMARNYRIYFIEEPIHDTRALWLEVTSPLQNVQVCRPHTPNREPGFARSQMLALRRLIGELVARESLWGHVVWLYTPMAYPLARSLRPRVLVYDCMDDLSGFLNAPRQLLKRESELLRAADIVFTGGPSLFKLKQHRSTSIHCFPSSVDVAHFDRGADRSLSHPEQARIPGPRLGYYGVIDERLDLLLIDAVAAAHPDWQLIMVGPVVKIDPGSLPRRANIHYLGQQSYDDLPRFLAGWDVCLMPFARNSATRFISPTKTLEYMAALKPIVTTPVADVILSYGHIVHAADTVASFIAACESALTLSDASRHESAMQMRAVLRRTSWDSTAQSMRELLENVPPRRTSLGRTSSAAEACSVRVSPGVTSAASPVIR